jgi:hypothetical protein
MSMDKETITDLYETVSNNFRKCNDPLLEVKNAIENSNLIKKPTKKVLLARIETIFTEANAIVDKIGSMGKVK